MVRCTTIDFEHLQVQNRPPAIHKFSDTEMNNIDTEITRLVNKKVQRPPGKLVITFPHILENQERWIPSIHLKPKIT